MLPSQVGRLRPSLMLLQRSDNLLFREPCSLHLSVLSGRTLTPLGGKTQWQVRERAPPFHLPRNKKFLHNVTHLTVRYRGLKLNSRYIIIKRPSSITSKSLASFNMHQAGSLLIAITMHALLTSRLNRSDLKC